ncbi:ABC transporter ATP-binding protein [Streptomyces sp. NPDC126514]|uniref:ABC transporter ATP-binding protein n=1 Tax=Streptomyces sp. NPDC126514 TaxID=3155210 RepID=UPI003329F3A8
MSPAPATPPLLTAHQITKSYGRSQALRGVTLHVAPGEIVAVTGPSGCGKSTLLHVMSGILRPDTGEVHFAGSRIDDINETRRSLLRRTDFGVVFQFGQLVAELPAVENVALPLMLRGEGRGAAMARAADWLDRLGVAEVADQLPGEMSGGQQQRVALARAFVTGPRVLFTDEPTGALDSRSGGVVLEHLVQAARTEGTSVVLVTHDAAIAARADREVRMRDGLLHPATDAAVGAGAEEASG